MKLVDTSVVADIDRGVARDRIAALDDEGRHAVSVVTVTELRLGVNIQYERKSEAYSSATEGLDRLITRFEVLAVSRAVATAAADIIADLRASGQRLDDLHDVYIAATALTEQLPVLTANVDHFDRIEGIQVFDWEDY